MSSRLLLRRGRSRLAALTGLLVLAAGVALALAGSRPAATAPPARPDIVFILTDDQSLDISRMPYVNGRTDWVRFSRAVVNQPLCCPSRATLLSGLYSHHTGVETNLTGQRFNDRSTIATWLRRAGYRTAHVGKYLNGYPWSRGPTYVPPGWSDWRAFTGSSRYYGYRLNRNRRVVAFGSGPQDYSTDVLAREAVDVIRRTRGPLFLQLAFNAPHGPFTPAPRHADAFRDLDVPRPANFNEGDVSDKPAWAGRLKPRAGQKMTEQIRQRHATMLAVDDGVRAVFGELARTGRLGNTVVVFMTDNGFANGEHRWDGKNCPYEECVRTPLLVRTPGRAGRVESRLASNVDIAPTFAALGRARAPRTDGRSLLPLLLGRRTGWRGSVLLHARPAGADEGSASQPEPPVWWALRTPRFKYIRWEAGGAQELYDLARDPAELTNVAAQPAYAATRRRLASQLTTLRTARP